MADETQYHVTLRCPVALKLAGSPVLVRCFDATMVMDGPSDPKCPGWIAALGFRTVKIWQIKIEGGLISHKITQTIIVQADNIAGLVAQPFDK